MPAPGRHHLKATGPRPIDKFTGQRWLVTIGHRIDNPCLDRCLIETCATKSVGFNRCIDNIFAMLKRGYNVMDGGNRIAGAFNNHVNCRMADKGLPIVTNKTGAGFHRVIKRCGIVFFGWPTNIGKIRTGI